MGGWDWGGGGCLWADLGGIDGLEWVWNCIYLLNPMKAASINSHASPLGGSNETASIPLGLLEDCDCDD